MGPGPLVIRILFVEKDTASSAQLVPSLERNGYEVAEARTQRQALNRIGVQRPDMLILNVASFGAAGYRVCDSVRSRLDDVPAILLLEEGHAAAGRGADAFMLPPFTPRKLLFRVRKVDEKIKRRELRAGPLVLDIDSRTLRKGGEVRQLRPKETDLLAYLMRNPGKVLKRQELMREVWDTEYYGDTRTLSVHVCWLRVHIEDDPRSPQFLRTVRGVGYRFEVPKASRSA